MPFVFGHLTATSPSLWQEMWQFLSDKYFSVSFEDYNYDHITLSSSSFFSVQGIIIAVFLGMIVAAAMTLFQKRTLGDLVRALDRESCYDATSAKTLEELGLLRSAAIKQALRRGTSLGRIVHCVEQEEYLTAQAQKREAFEAEQAAIPRKSARRAWRDVPYKHDFMTDRFYIPEDKAFGAISHFSKKGSDPLTFGLTIVICIALMMLCCFLLPEMLKLADNFIGVFRNV